MLSTPQEPFVTPAASVLPEWVSRQLSSRLSLRSLRGPSGRLSASAGGQPAGAAGPGGGGGGALTDSPKHSAPGSEAEAAAPGAPAQQQQQQRQDDRQPSGELHIVVALPSSQLPSCTMGSTGNTASQKLQQDTVPDDAPSLAYGQPAGAAAPPAQVSQAPQSAARRRLWLAWSFFRQYYLQAACIVPAAALVVTCITPLRNLLVPDQVGPRACPLCHARWACCAGPLLRTPAAHLDTLAAQPDPPAGRLAAPSRLDCRRRTGPRAPGRQLAAAHPAWPPRCPAPADRGTWLPHGRAVLHRNISALCHLVHPGRGTLPGEAAP